MESVCSARAKVANVSAVLRLSLFLKFWMIHKETNE